MMLSISPPILFIRYAFRRIGFKRVIVVLYERIISKDDEKDSTSELNFELTNGLNIDIKLLQKIIPEGIVLSFYKKFYKIRYDRKINQMLEEYKQRLINGDICFIGFLKGDPVGFTWVSTQKTKYEPSIDTTLINYSGSSIIYGSIIYPKYRKRGFSKNLYAHVIRFLAKNGFNKVQAIVQKDNIPSRRSFTSIGFIEKRMIRRIQILNYSKVTELSIGEKCTELKIQGGE